VSISSTSSNISKSSNTIELFKGESKDLVVTVTQLSEAASDNECVDVYDPVDLTGATVFFTVRKSVKEALSILEKDSTNALEIEVSSPATTGVATIYITSGDTVGLDAGTYVFDIWVELSSGKRSPVIEISEFIVRDAVKRW